MHKYLETAYQALGNLTKTHYKDTANMLKVTMAVGWGLSSLAQIGAIMINDKIPAKEKRFLIPQEMYDGAINVALFLLLTSRMKKWGGNLLKNKIIATEKSSKEYLNYKDFKESFLTISSLIGSALASNLVTPIVRNKFAAKSQKNYTRKTNAELYEFKKFGDRSPSTPRPYDMKSFLHIAKTGSLRV